MAVLSDRRRSLTRGLQACGLGGRKPQGDLPHLPISPPADLRPLFISAVDRDTAEQQSGRLPQPRTCGPARRAPSYLQAGGSGASPIQQRQRNGEAVAGTEPPGLTIPAPIRESRILGSPMPSSGGLAL